MQLFASFAMRVFSFEGFVCFRNATALTSMTIAAPQDCKFRYASNLPGEFYVTLVEGIHRQFVFTYFAEEEYVFSCWYDR